MSCHYLPATAQRSISNKAMDNRQRPSIQARASSNQPSTSFESVVQNEPVRQRRRSTAESAGNDAVSNETIIRALKHHITYLELENTNLRNLLTSSAKNNRTKSTTSLTSSGTHVPSKYCNAQFFDGELEEATKTVRFRNDDDIEHHVRQRSAELQSLLLEKKELLDRITRLEELQRNDRRSLSEEVIELRKRLDDNAPILAAKERQLVTARDELSRHNSALRAAQDTIELMRQELEQKDMEERLFRNTDNDRKSEIESLLRKVDSLEAELVEQNNKRQVLQDEINSLRKQMKEQELQNKRDKAVADKIAEENAQLINENAELTTRLSHSFQPTRNEELGEICRHPPNITQELANLRESERSLRADLLRTEETLKMELLKQKQAQMKLSAQELNHRGLQESKLQLEDHLSSLETSNRNMITECQQLRHDKMLLETKVTELRQLMASKDDHVRDLTTNLNLLQNQNNELDRRLREEHNQQQVRAKEVEKLAQQVQSVVRSNFSLVKDAHLPSSSTASVRLSSNQNDCKRTSNNQSE